ncbi:two-component system response regulator CseB [Streptomyces indicus]|uniref:DNA-binding response regulator, OmpR family, contains REC and winged-helix (WHTH) domain n=1 Tax=Streptomyces indicus TaxID=417292 RepID=A0A1G9D8L5_9ACTN|nr:two-component system response regulator CseB [Streptomyces indicus]SDK60085.1 DNA-binding response regulator, OmpR family, contains REC and winged-helix (wHTH) domain [Streptomyces indicus]
MSGSRTAVSVLVVEDDAVIRRSVQLALERYGYEVTAAEDGLGGLDAYRAGQQDLLILDVMLPGLDGIGLCRRIREESLVPVLMMSARDDALDVVAGLEAGADDYVVKPVDIGVMVARIRSLLRRATVRADAATDEADRTGAGIANGTANGTAARPLVFGDLSVDPLGLTVHRAGTPVPLAPTELKLLLMFAEHPGIVLDRRRLLREVWDYGWEGDTRVVDVAVVRLRKKIGAERIETVRGFGYKLVKA